MEGTLNNDEQLNNKQENTRLENEENILNSNDVNLIARYAKENRSKVAIDKARELLELARRNGEEIVQNFLSSFKECEGQKKDYLDFEKTESGQLALSLLVKMPEPFKTNAYKRLEDYKKELACNTELFKKHKNNPETIWKEFFGFDYYNIPDFKERFKNFLFKDIKAISKESYKDSGLEAQQDPFAINFFIKDQKNFDRAYEKEIEDDDYAIGGFSRKTNGTNVNVISTNESSIDGHESRDISEITQHEAEHAIHRHTNPIVANVFEDESLQDNISFDFNIERLNSGVKFDFEERLKLAKDETFAYLKAGNNNKEDVESLLTDKDANSSYDYGNVIRSLNNEVIKNNIHLSETEKQKLKEGINFLQSEYDRVLKNMIDVIYEKNYSVEFFRNVPINELWKYSNGKYNRTDFIIKKFKP